MNKPDARIKRRFLCLFIILFIIIAISSITFYFSFRYIPDNTEKIDELTKEWQIEKLRLSKVPKEKNAWKDYEEAAKIMEMTEQNNPERISCFSYNKLWDQYKEMSKESIRENVSDSIPLNREILSHIDDGFGKEFGSSTIRLKHSPWMMEFYPIEGLIGYTLLSGINCENNHKTITSAKRYLQSIHISNAWRLYVGYNYRNVDNCIYSIKRLAGLLKKEKDNRELAEYVLKESGRISENWTTFKSNIIYGLWRNQNARFYISSEAGYPSTQSDSLDTMIFMTKYSSYLKYSNSILLDYSRYYKKPYPESITLMNREPISNFPYMKEPLEQSKDTLIYFYNYSVETRTRFDGMRIVAALNLYRLDNGGYPESLDLLAPKYFKKVPNDGFAVDGKFIYRKKPDGSFILYSVGQDMKDDDRALVEKGSLERRDIVVAE